MLNALSGQKNILILFLLRYDDDDYSQGYGQIKEAFRALTKNDFLQLYISDHDYGSS